MILSCVVVVGLCYCIMLVVGIVGVGYYEGVFVWL